MYLKYYLLREAPFGITPDPAFLYLSPSHKEALASVLYGIGKRKGFITITGEVGCGKTTVLRAILKRTDPERVTAVYLFNPELSFAGLVRAIFQELGLEAPANNDLDAAVRHLHHFLIEKYREGRHVVLMIDEAQRMAVGTLERLRILSNLETAKDKLLQIVLCGQPEFEQLLARHELRQLRQRVAVRATIRPLSRAESKAYIERRLRKVRYGRTPVFSSAALKRIVRHAKGNPRTINIVCDNALVAGYSYQEKPITGKTVKEVIAGLDSSRRVAIPRWALVGGAVCLLVTAGSLSFWGADLMASTVSPSSDQRAVSYTALETAAPASGAGRAIRTGPVAGAGVGAGAVHEASRGSDVGGQGAGVVNAGFQSSPGIGDADLVYERDTMVFPEVAAAEK